MNRYEAYHKITEKTTFHIVANSDKRAYQLIKKAGFIQRLFILEYIGYAVDAVGRFCKESIEVVNSQDVND